MIGWERFRPGGLRLLPGALIGVVAATVLATALDLPVKRVEVPSDLIAGLSLPDLDSFGRLLEPAVIVAVLGLALIASAESLLSAAAVDRMHDGERTNYDRELGAQGVGNALCGLLGALPITGVIVRSSANVQAGAASRMSAVLHGLWILAFVAALPWLLALVPTASLAGVLIVTGWRLIGFQHARELLHRHGFLPALIWGVTFTIVVAVDLLSGVLVGFALALVEVVPHLRRRHLLIRRHDTGDGTSEMRLAGSATFLHLPRLARALDAVPQDSTLRLKTHRLAYIDHTCREMITDWAARRAAGGAGIEVDGREAKHEQRLRAALRDT